MGFQYRKSKSFGPVRITASKRGIGASVGFGPVRFTKRADRGYQGTARVPGSGIRYVHRVGSAPRTQAPRLSREHAAQRPRKQYTAGEYVKLVASSVASIAVYTLIWHYAGPLVAIGVYLLPAVLQIVTRRTNCLPAALVLSWNFAWWVLNVRTAFGWEPKE